MTFRAFLATILCLTGQSAAQQAPAPEGAVTFSSKVNLVSVPVVVRDVQGRAVGNLRLEDFQLFDKGKLQVITRFSIEKSEAPLVGAKTADVARTVAPVRSQPALPERYIAYLVDDIHLKSGDLLQTRQAMHRHLDQSLEPNSRAAIFTTSGRVMADFTDDREKLHKAVNGIMPSTSVTSSVCPQISYYMADVVTNRSFVLSGFTNDDGKGGLSPGTKDDTGGVLVDVLKAGIKLCGAPDVRAVRAMVHQIVAVGENEAKLSLGLVNDAIRKLSVMPGNRNLVLVSPGFLVTRDLRLAESDVFERAIRANVAINTIDMRGLYTLMGDPGNYYSRGSAQQYEISQASEEANVLAELADNTGGTFFHDDNGLKEGLNRLAARPEYLYVLGFSPQDLKNDGSYHTLKVKVANLHKAALTGPLYGGLSLQVRRGYWAPNHAADASETAKDEIREAVFSMDEIRDIPADVQTAFFKSSDQKAELTVTEHLEARNNDTVTVVTGLFDANGNYVAGIQRVVDMRLRDQTSANLRNFRITVEETFNVGPGRYVVRMVVRDTEGKTMAARNKGVEIR